MGKMSPALVAIPFEVAFREQGGRREAKQSHAMFAFLMSDNFIFASDFHTLQRPWLVFFVKKTRMHL